MQLPSYTSKTPPQQPQPTPILTAPATPLPCHRSLTFTPCHHNTALRPLFRAAAAAVQDHSLSIASHRHEPPPLCHSHGLRPPNQHLPLQPRVTFTVNCQPNIALRLACNRGTCAANRRNLDAHRAFKLSAQPRGSTPRRMPSHGPCLLRSRQALATAIMIQKYRNAFSPLTFPFLLYGFSFVINSVRNRDTCFSLP